MSNMKTIAKDPRAQSVVLATVAGALVVAIGAPSHDDPAREDKLATLGEALKGDDRATKAQPAQAAKIDVEPLAVEIRKLKAECPDCVDLGVKLVEPGVTDAHGGNFPKGARLVAVEGGGFTCPGHIEAEGLVCILDPGEWAVTLASCTDREDATWCEVTARNTGDKAQRFLALVRAEP